MAVVMGLRYAPIAKCGDSAWPQKSEQCRATKAGESPPVPIGGGGGTAYCRVVWLGMHTAPHVSVESVPDKRCFEISTRCKRRMRPLTRVSIAFASQCLKTHGHAFG